MQEDQLNVAQQGGNISKPVWLEQTGQSAVIIFGVASGILVQLLSGYKSIPELHFHVTISFIWSLFLVLLLASNLMILKCHISRRTRISHNLKMILMFLNLFDETVAMATNVFFLAMVDKSCLQFLFIPVIEFILVAMLIIFELKLDENQEPPGDNEDYICMVKNSYKVASAATSTSFVVQAAVIICYLKNPAVSLKNHPQYSLIGPFLISVLGSFARSISSFPLQFQSDLMRGLLKKIPNVLLVSQGLFAAFLSARFLDPAKEVFAVSLPFILGFVVNLCQRSSKQQITEDTLISTDQINEVDSMFGALAGFGITVLSTIYSAKFVSEGCDLYLTYLVFFFLLATISSLMRMAFLFRPTHTVIEYVIDALPMVPTLVGIALLLKEFSTTIGMDSAGKPIPTLGPLSPFPH